MTINDGSQGAFAAGTGRSAGRDRRLEERLERKGDYGLGKGDPSIYEWEMCLALKQRAENKARSLEVALRKAEEGDYGLCEVCGQAIDPARLAILPHTKRCIDCAQKR